jgi:hypothetical protein
MTVRKKAVVVNKQPTNEKGERHCSGCGSWIKAEGNFNTQKGKFVGRCRDCRDESRTPLVADGWHIKAASEFLRRATI